MCMWVPLHIMWASYVFLSCVHVYLYMLLDVYVQHMGYIHMYRMRGIILEDEAGQLPEDWRRQVSYCVIHGRLLSLFPGCLSLVCHRCFCPPVPLLFFSVLLQPSPYSLVLLLSIISWSSPSSLVSPSFSDLLGFSYPPLSTRSSSLTLSSSVTSVLPLSPSSLRLLYPAHHARYEYKISPATNTHPHTPDSWTFQLPNGVKKVMNAICSVRVCLDVVTSGSSWNVQGTCSTMAGEQMSGVNPSKSRGIGRARGLVEPWGLVEPKDW